jgi:small subunit ribosomal protein S6
MPVDDDFRAAAARWYRGRVDRLDPRTCVGVGPLTCRARPRVRRTPVLLPRRRRGRLSPKEVETALRAYEVMVILNPDLEERTVGPSLDTYLNVVRNDGGSIENVDVWGRRRLAYEIDKFAEGIYAVVTLNAEPATVKELDRQLTLNESVLRTKVIRPDVH